MRNVISLSGHIKTGVLTVDFGSPWEKRRGFRNGAFDHRRLRHKRMPCVEQHL